MDSDKPIDLMIDELFSLDLLHLLLVLIECVLQSSPLNSLGCLPKTII
jgi:hypothetical protein